MNNFRAKNLIAAPFTPLFENGEINIAMIDKYVDYMVSTNFTGIFVNGTLGEGFSMTQDERKRLAEAWSKACQGRLEVIVHVGTNCIKDSLDLAGHAEKIGATAIAALSPFYYKPENEEVLLELMTQIAAAAPNTPFYYYDINVCTGLYINQRRFMEMAKQHIPTLRGLKFSSPELPNAHDCSMIDDCQVLMGTDSQYLSCLCLGMSTVVSASYLGNLFSDMRLAFEAGNLSRARELQVTAQTIHSIIEKHGGGINITKYVFKILVPDIDVGPVRLPLRQMTTPEIEAMKQDFTNAGLLDISKPRH